MKMSFKIMLILGVGISLLTYADTKIIQCPASVKCDGNTCVAIGPGSENFKWTNQQPDAPVGILSFSGAMSWGTSQEPDYSFCYYGPDLNVPFLLTLTNNTYPSVNKSWNNGVCNNTYPSNCQLTVINNSTINRK